MSSGAQCRFICREHPGNLIEQIRARGFAVSALASERSSDSPLPLREGSGEGETTHSAWLGVDWVIDAAQTRVGAGETEVDWLIVDHYALDARWEQALRPACRKLMVIDDLADRPHDCDLLLDQNLGRDAHDYVRFVPKECMILAGPSYALLRPEFAALRDYSLHRRAIPQVKHLLIAMGGVDQADATSQILEALKGCSLPEDARITVVMGPHAPWLERVRLLAAQMPQPTEVKVNVQDMALLMADSDLAIGAAGSTSWERCCLGLPTLMLVLAENQREVGLNLEGDQAVLMIELGCDFEKMLRNDIAELLQQNALQTKMIKNASRITDGGGCKRVLIKMFDILAPIVNGNKIERLRSPTSH